VGKNNLYKLFICRAVELARAGGYISFIVPMPLLGDEQARGIREALLRDGSFLQIHAFPQKDNPSRRVFRDAKLSTAMFVFRKGTVPGQEPAPFPSVRHPGRRDSEASKGRNASTEAEGNRPPGGIAARAVGTVGADGE
jgi:Eco57I restriction-modification methylase